MSDTWRLFLCNSKVDCLRLLRLKSLKWDICIILTLPTQTMHYYTYHKTTCLNVTIDFSFKFNTSKMAMLIRWWCLVYIFDIPVHIRYKCALCPGSWSVCVCVPFLAWPWPIKVMMLSLFQGCFLGVNLSWNPITAFEFTWISLTFSLELISEWTPGVSNWVMATALGHSRFPCDVFEQVNAPKLLVANQDHVVKEDQNKQRQANNALIYKAASVRQV